MLENMMLMWRHSRALLHRTGGRLFSSSSCLQITPEVQEALKHGEPVVALESTIVAHGMPYPQNLEIALKVESILREKVRRFNIWVDAAMLFNSRSVRIHYNHRV